MSKVYAVRNGIMKGVFNSWKDCEKQVKGFSGAEFKSFSKMEDALLYLGLIEKKKLINTAYVDGSFNGKEYGCGGLIFDQDGNKFEFSFKGSDKDFVDLENVAGEILSAKRAIEFCISSNMKEIKICHDYLGVANWCNGNWGAKKIGTKLYQDYYNSVKNHINISFEKVDAHSNDEYNDVADSLSRKALKLKK